MLRFILSALALCLLAAVLVVTLALDGTPTVLAPPHLDAVRTARARALLHDYDPRRLRDGEERSLVISRDELALILDHLARLLPDGAASVALTTGRLDVRLSLRVPVVPGTYLNLQLGLNQTDRLPEIVALQLGDLPVPAPLASRLAARALRSFYERAGLGEPGSLVRAVAFTDQQVMLRYEWQSSIVDALRLQLISPSQQARIRAFNDELVALCARHAGAVRLPELAAPLFAVAAARSADGGDPQADNQALLLVLTHYVTGRNLALLMPDAAQWPQPLAHPVRLQGRSDLVRHFLISALLAAAGGDALAGAMGTAKELEDSRRGSGFSFVDLLADEAGTLFGQRATASAESARRLQTQAAAAAADDAWLPSLAGLPERLGAAEFQRRYGAADTGAYRNMLRDIRQRLAALPVYR